MRSLLVRPDDANKWPRLLFITFVIGLGVNVALNAFWVATAFDGLKDLDSFLHSGAAHARGLDPYGYYWWLKPPPISPEALNLNPPISVYLFQPLSFLDREYLGTAFFIAAIAMLVASVVLLVRAYPEKRHWFFILLVASMAGVWQMLWYMQIYGPLLLAMTAAWLCFRRGDWLLAGILIGFTIAVKPNYGLVALVLLIAGHWRPAITSVASAGVLSLVPIIVDGPHLYWQWLHLTQTFDGYAWTSNASFVSIGARLHLAPLGQAMAVAVAVGVFYLVRRWRPDPLESVALGTLCVILVGPVSWAGYTLLLLPYLFSIRWDRWTWLAVGLLATPFAPVRAIAALGIDMPNVSAPDGVVDAVAGSPLLTMLGAVVMPLIGAIYAWAVLVLLVRLCQQLARERGDSFPGIFSRRRTSAVRRTRRPARVRPAPRPAAPAGAKPGGAVAIRLRSDA